MAHTKLLKVHSAVLTAAIEHYLTSQPTVHPAVSGSLMAAVQANIKDDPADLAGLPPDAHVVAHYVSTAGEVSLIIESQMFPWSPDGLPLDKMPVFTPTAAVPAPAAQPLKPPPIPAVAPAPAAPEAKPESAPADKPVDAATAPVAVEPQPETPKA
jgi:hypothetical protein